MADYKADEILVIEKGTEYVTKSKPFKVKAKLSEILPGIRSGIKKIVIGDGIVAIGDKRVSQWLQGNKILMDAKNVIKYSKCDLS